MIAPNKKAHLNGDEIESAIKTCFLDEIKQGASKIYKLGIPLFTVSSGTIAILLTLYNFFHKTSQEKVTLVTLCLALLILFISAIVAIALLLPRPREISGQIDLFNEYNVLMERFAAKLKWWIAIWLLGTLLGVLSLFI